MATAHLPTLFVVLALLSVSSARPTDEEIRAAVLVEIADGTPGGNQANLEIVQGQRCPLCRTKKFVSVPLDDGRPPISLSAQVCLRHEIYWITGGGCGFMMPAGPFQLRLGGAADVSGPLAHGVKVLHPPAAVAAGGDSLPPVHSPDGSLVATTDFPSPTVRVRNNEGEDVLVDRGRREGGVSVVFSPESNAIAVLRMETIRVFSLPEGELSCELPVPSGWLAGAAFDPQGDRLALFLTAGRRGPNRIEILDIAAAAVQVTMTGAGDRVLEKQWSPDGTRIVVADDEGYVRAWRADDGRRLFAERVLEQPAGRKAGDPAPKRESLALATSPDGETLAVSDGQTLVLLDAASGKVSRRVRGEAAPARTFSTGRPCVAFAPEGDQIAWIRFDGSIHFQSHPDGGKHRFFYGDGAMRSLWFSEDGGTILTRRQDRAVLEWDLAEALRYKK